MTKQYILLAVFSPYPRSDAEEDGNLEKPMGPEKKSPRKTPWKNQSVGKDTAEQERKFQTVTICSPAKHLWKKHKLTQILTTEASWAAQMATLALYQGTTPPTPLGWFF